MEKEKGGAEVLIPMEVTDFFRVVRTIVQEELRFSARKEAATVETTGWVQKPIYSMDEVRKLFDNVSRSTIYEWIEAGLLKPKKMRGLIYFLWRDIEAGLEKFKKDEKPDMSADMPGVLKL